MNSAFGIAMLAALAGDTSPSGGDPGIWDRMCSWFPVLVDRPWLAAVVPAGAILLLVLVFKFIRATTRVK